MKACRWGGVLSLSLFIHPWISDYSQNYTQSILQKWLQIHKMLNIYRLVKACRGLSRFFKGLLRKSNRWDMSVSLFISPLCPQRAAVASGHSPLTLGIIWKKNLMLLVILHPCICLKIIGQEPSLQKESMKE